MPVVGSNKGGIPEALDESVSILVEPSKENWRSLNARMIITIFYATGMRLSELINLKEKQVDFARSQIKVLGKGNKERIIPISAELAHSIKEYQQLKRKEFEISEEEAGQEELAE